MKKIKKIQVGISLEYWNFFCIFKLPTDLVVVLDDFIKDKNRNNYGPVAVDRWEIDSKIYMGRDYWKSIHDGFVGVPSDKCFSNEILLYFIDNYQNPQPYVFSSFKEPSRYFYTPRNEGGGKTLVIFFKYQLLET